MLVRILSAFVLCLLAVSNVGADVIYQIDDGSAEFTLGIDPGEDMVWMNTFPVEAGGERISAISAAFGRPGLGQSLNGLQVSALLYEDFNGGSPVDAVLLQQTSGIVVAAHTNTLVQFDFPATEVHGTLVAAILFRNTTNELKFIGAIDRTPPHVENRSYAGFAVGLLEANLASIPAMQFGTLATFNIAGNLMVRAIGQAVPEPSPGFTLAVGLPLCVMFSRRR